MTEETTVFILCETDDHKSHSSRVIMGVFESRELAQKTFLDARTAGEIHNEANFDILETTLNELQEL